MSEVFVRFNIFIIVFMLSLMVPSALFAKDADELYREGQFAEAEKEYKKGDMDNPKDTRFRYNRGCAAFQNSDYKGAVASFTSVIRRSKDKNSDLVFRSSYNLGNTAFVQGDFASAAQYYKMALKENPESKEAKYNLELAIKKQKEAEEQKDGDQQEDKDKKDQQEEGDQNKPDKDEGKNQEKQEGQQDQSEGQDNEDKKEQDLSGELSSANPMEDKMSEQEQQAAAAAMLDKKKAEALLDNIKEDRAKILQYQMPKDKKDNAKSGKAW